jgi:hypothetical protein
MRRIHIAIGLSAVTTLAALTLNAETVSVEPPQPKEVAPPRLVLPIVPEEEPIAATSTNAGFSAATPFAAHAGTADEVSPNSSSVLTGPAQLNYSGSSAALEVSASGTGKAIQATINNPKNSSSAVYGLTNGTAAGLTGYNSGTGGPAGKIIIINESSPQSALFASTNGTGSAITATVTNTALGGTYPAVLAQNAGSLGIIGDGASVGVQGNSTGGEGYGVAGYSLAKGSSSKYGAGIGVYGASGSGNGVEGTNQACCGAGVSGTSSTNGYGVYGGSVKGIGIAAYSGASTAIVASAGGATFTANGEAVNVQSVSTPGIVAHSVGSVAIEGYSDKGVGVAGSSTNAYGVSGYDAGTGVGVYGMSAKGLAGRFDGNVSISGTLTVGSTTYTSDKNLKADVRPIDRQDLLERVGSLPISSWDYKSDTTRRHIGPMAQDFHAAFGLNGADETHINEVDIAGVSLAAIQELHRQMQQKDAQIEKLEAEQAANVERTNELAASFAKRLAELETKLNSNSRYAALNQR